MDIFFAIDKSDPKARIQAFLDVYKDPSYQGFEAQLMRTLRVMSASANSSLGSNPALGDAATATFELPVLPEFLNPRGHMHGGAVALLVDMCTTLAVAPISRADFWHFGGVSRTINVTYLKPIEGGSVIVVECAVKGIGKRLASIQCSVKRKDGLLLALGEHGKAFVDAKPSQQRSKI